MDRRRYVGWIIAAVFLIFAVAIDTFLIGFGFTALICYGCSAAAGSYQVLWLLKSRFPKKILWIQRILTTVIVLGVLAGVYTGAVIFRASKGSADTHCDYLIVLGAGVNGSIPSLSLQERLDAAYDYMHENSESICVVTGCQGKGEDISEAQCMYQVLTARGISPERVLKEDQARNTRENIKFSLEIIEKQKGLRPKEIAVVSSEYHLFRAGLFAEEQQVAFYGVPAHTGWTSLRINYYLREIAAVWYYAILGG